MTNELETSTADFLPAIEAEMRAVLRAGNPTTADPFYGMIHYHMGWADEVLQAAGGNRGKRIRPLLCLLACAAAGGDWRLAVPAAAAIEMAVAMTVDYTRQRPAFGQKLSDFQNTRFKLAECATLAHVVRGFVNECTQRLLDGTLDDEAAYMAKWWCTEQQCKVVDECLQLFGGYGYMTEYPIARLYADARVQKIYGGANEVMKDLIARKLFA